MTAIDTGHYIFSSTEMFFCIKPLWNVIKLYSDTAVTQLNKNHECQYLIVKEIIKTSVWKRKKLTRICSI